MLGRQLSHLAPPVLYQAILKILVDYDSIGGRVLLLQRPYEINPDRPEDDDLTAWIESGWSRGFPPTAEPRGHDIKPPIQELFFKYKHRDELLSEKIKLVIQQALFGH